jgi:hypothetical protein
MNQKLFKDKYLKFLTYNDQNTFSLNNHQFAYDNKPIDQQTGALLMRV